MASSSWDRSGQGGDVLRALVRDFGPEVLSNPQLLKNLLGDKLPTALREYPRYKATGDPAAHAAMIAAGFAPGSEFLWDFHYAVYWDLTQRIYRIGSHCQFSQPEMTKAFDDLVAWVKTGVKPQGDEVDGDLSNAGITFTNPLRPNDPGGRAVTTSTKQ